MKLICCIKCYSLPAAVNGDQQVGGRIVLGVSTKLLVVGTLLAVPFVVSQLLYRTCAVYKSL